MILDQGKEVTECENNIERLSEKDCRDVPVRVKWRYCNKEDWTIDVIPELSKMKLRGKTHFMVQEQVPGNTCIEHSVETILNTCEEKKTWLGKRWIRCFYKIVRYFMA